VGALESSQLPADRKEASQCMEEACVATSEKLPEGKRRDECDEELVETAVSCKRGANNRRKGGN